MPSSASDDHWFCELCNGKWIADNDDVWIQCDSCDIPFHLQCCGLEYDKFDYYELDLEAIEFVCFNCDTVSEEEILVNMD